MNLYNTTLIDLTSNTLTGIQNFKLNWTKHNILLFYIQYGHWNEFGWIHWSYENLIMKRQMWIGVSM
jgi:hypothetical protein